MRPEDAVSYVQSYGPREVPGVGRRGATVVSQEVMVGWWDNGQVHSRRARIEGVDGDTVVFYCPDLGRRWVCPAADLSYIRRWPE